MKVATIIAFAVTIHQAQAVWYFLSRYAMRRDTNETIPIEGIHRLNELDKRAYSIGVYKLCKDTSSGRQCIVDQGGIGTTVGFAVENSGYWANQDLFEAVGSWSPDGTIFTGNWRNIWSNGYMQADMSIGSPVMMQNYAADIKEQIWLVQGSTSWKAEGDWLCGGYTKPTFSDSAGNLIHLGCEGVDNYVPAGARE